MRSLFQQAEVIALSDLRYLPRSFRLVNLDLQRLDLLLEGSCSRTWTSRAMRWKTRPSFPSTSGRPTTPSSRFELELARFDRARPPP